MRVWMFLSSQMLKMNEWRLMDDAISVGYISS